MFEWNDQQITNIIWGEAKESDDHIVPYPAEAANVNPNDKNNPHARTAKTEQIIKSQVSKNITHVPKHKSSIEGDNSEQEMEQDGFVNYEWANIGSFDDLDKIFCEDDTPIFGRESVNNAQELWTSSKDITSRSDKDKSIPLPFDSPNFTSQHFQEHDSFSDSMRGKSKPLQKDKDIYGPMNQLSQFEPIMGQPLYPPIVKNRERQLLVSESSMYSNISTQYPQNMVSYAPMSMTPQEKIEKLRRRQQMRAMLAIQKQQKQFNNNKSSTPPIIRVDKNVCILPSLEQDDSDNSADDSVLLHRLQNIIMKMDLRVRLSIRDSLFRLAQSATQRQFSNSTVRIDDVETKTNHVDRTVAHLLFHTPLESSGKHAQRSVLSFQPQSS